MIFNLQFVPHLLGCLKNSEYVLFEHFALHKPSIDFSFNFLVRKKDHQRIIDEIQSFSEIGVVDCKKNINCSELKITFKDGSKIQTNILHRFAINNFNYMEVEQVFSKKQRSKSEVFMPNIEHLFEFAILSNFLNGRGLTPAYQAYFEDFHFFVRDGLLDFFNEKYGTQFTNLDDLTTFEIDAKSSILDSLKKMPENHFLSKASLQWLKFIAPRA